jgi:hypothetical protein
MKLRTFAVLLFIVFLTLFVGITAIWSQTVWGVIMRAAPHDLGPMWVATPLSYDFCIHYTSPVLTAHKEYLYETQMARNGR